MFSTAHLEICPEPEGGDSPGSAGVGFALPAGVDGDEAIKLEILKESGMEGRNQGETPVGEAQDEEIGQLYKIGQGVVEVQIEIVSGDGFGAGGEVAHPVV
jgi:hypothetical protein